MNRYLLFFLVLTSLSTTAEGRPDFFPLTQADPDSMARQLLYRWNEAHNTKDLAVFSDVFGTDLIFYDMRLSNEDCVARKKDLFETYPAFYQEIKDPVSVFKKSETEISCTFTKRVNTGKKWKEYPSYLLFISTPLGWKISIEGDEITDRNLAKMRAKKNGEVFERVRGDFNGDGIKEYMWLEPQEMDFDIYDCGNKCHAYIYFSSPLFPKIRVENCRFGTPDNLGDLDGDGADEVGNLPGWLTSCWRRYRVWTFRDGAWHMPVGEISVHCNLWEDTPVPISKHKTKKGYVNISYCTHEDDIMIRKKVVQLK